MGTVDVCHDDGEDVWVIDPNAQKLVTAIKIPTDPEFVVYDPVTDTVFHNIKSQPVTLVIDPGPNSVADVSGQPCPPKVLMDWLLTRNDTGCFRRAKTANWLSWTLFQENRWGSRYRRGS